MKIALPEPAAGVAAGLGAALVALGAWLLVPRERGSPAAARPPVRVCLVDTSASAVLRRSGWREFVESTLSKENESARSAGEDFETVLYGSEVRRITGPLGGIAAGEETRLAGAFEVARGLALDPARHRGRIVVIGDRTFTGEDPSPRIRELRGLGVAVDWIDLPPPDKRELAIGPLALPDEVEAGAPIAVEADAFFAPGAAAIPRRVSVAIERDGDRRAVEIPVPDGLPADADGYVRWRLRLDVGAARPGANRIRIEGSAGVVRSTGSLAVGAVACELAPALELALEPGIDLQHVQAEELGADLDRLDALVGGELPTDVLPHAVLASFIERGGGWLGFAGEDPLLPLQPPDDDRDPRDVVVLVDRSGSMSGEPFESVRRAVLRLVAMAPSRDAVELRFFGERLSDPVALKASGDDRERERILREAAERFFGTGAPGGSTAIARALEAFADSRERSGREALVFLLSDGKDTVDPDAAMRCARVLQRLSASRARLVVIAAGDAPDAELLSGLLAPGETLREVGPLATASESLADVFRREISKERFREGEHLRVLPAAAASASLAADVLAAQESDRSAAWPEIRRYARAKLAPGAEAIWVSERGEPLLAIHRVGQGLVAACAFDPSDPAWKSRGDLWTPVLRALARGHRAATPRARLVEGELTIENLPEGSPAELEARVFAPGARDGDPPAFVLPLSPRLEGQDPQRGRAARWPAVDFAGGLVRVEVRAGGGVDGAWRPIDLALAGPRSPERVLPRPRVDPHALETSIGGAQARTGTGPRPHPSAPWVLFSGLLLLAVSGLAGFFARRPDRA